MIKIDDVTKIICLVLAVGGALGLIVGIMSFFGTESNPALVAGGAVSLAIGLLIARTF